jgi:prephenate dehydrogenase
MFLDILLTNRAAVLAQLDNAAGHLAELRDLLADGDETALRAKLARSQHARAAWKKHQP